MEGVLESAEAAADYWNPNGKCQGGVSGPSALCSGDHVLCAEDQECTMRARDKFQGRWSVCCSKGTFPGALWGDSIVWLS